MLVLPVLYRRYGRSNIDFDSVYKAMHSKDLSDCVVTALKVLKDSDTDEISNEDFEPKSTSESLEIGIEGKRAFCLGDNNMALVKFNMALMRAPQKSEAMMLAYYNRAEFLFKTNQFSSCLVDIETCLALNYSDRMADKLLMMKREACEKKWIEEIICEKTQNSPFSANFFKVKNQNPDIPCASSDVKIILESQQPKIVAAKDITVGTVLAIETSFVSVSHMSNHTTSCHYCHKMSFNLMPCEGCRHALFCDKHCKELSMREGHNIECKIIDIMLPDVNLCIKAVIKMRQMCSSWDELISESNNLGVDRMKNSSVADMFDSKKFSLLNSHNDSHFIYGTMFNRCVCLAKVIHYLDRRTSFLPSSPEQKNAAICAISRIMMHLTLYSTPMVLQHYTFVPLEAKVMLHKHPNKGYFPVTSSLRHSCLPNTYMLGMRNNVVLVALMPIKQGTELTVSPWRHWLELETETENGNTQGFMRRVRILFLHFRTVCTNCIICSCKGVLPQQLLNDTQKKAFINMIMYEAERNFLQDIQSIYIKACKTLHMLREVPCSMEYRKVFKTFVQCLMNCLHCQYPNVIME